MTLHEKMTMPDLQKYPCSLNLIKIIYDTKCLILIISPLLPKSNKCETHFRRETAKENKQLKKRKAGISYLIRD